ncbi:DUF4332 domain-containing protein [[Limnothrix rosea] IAM M-220]|uniref:DUF4332 domain-containing protein n=1 Tax=[Limnothrix rosea] IAM M-220 TaxID=454133 RepID=UPI0009633CA3|nr:DUF4332 domain-containing protein [[Limnothrix rosea] IAM M-220]OKH12702.1 hypothetical protein NIES208_15900 [[Limnothrix rosea] IAM M-220]
MASCNWAIADLPGLSAEHQKRLTSNHIRTTHQLLLATQNLKAKHDLAAKLQIHPQYVSKWIALADLARLKSVGVEYCGLILHCGIASVPQLAQTPFNRLHQSIVKLHVANMRRRDLAPSVGMVKQWVSEAKRLA